MKLSAKIWVSFFALSFLFSFPDFAFAQYEYQLTPSIGVSEQYNDNINAAATNEESDYITGLTPGGHGIADFIMRDPKTYMPVFSIYEIRDADRTLKLGDYLFPISGGGVENLRRGKPFWSYLTEQGIPAVVVKIPTNFPVDETATRATKKPVTA